MEELTLLRNDKNKIEEELTNIKETMKKYEETNEEDEGEVFDLVELHDQNTRLLNKIMEITVVKDGMRDVGVDTGDTELGEMGEIGVQTEMECFRSVVSFIEKNEIK